MDVVLVYNSLGRALLGPSHTRTFPHIVTLRGSFVTNTRGQRDQAPPQGQ